jgi:hypothetical protein
LRDAITQDGIAGPIRYSPVMLAPIPVLALAEKALPAVVSWAEPEGDGVMQFLAPLAVEDLTIAGLFLRGRAYQWLIRNILFVA